MPVYPFQGVWPRFGERVFLAPSAEVAGDVEVGDDVSFWFHTAARGDVNWIRIGARTNVQDGAVLHVTHERHPLTIGAGVVIGHGAVLHGCTVEDGALIGIGARVLDGAVVESRGAGRRRRGGRPRARGSRAPPGARRPGAGGAPARPTGSAPPSPRSPSATCALKERYRAALGNGAEEGTVEKVSGSASARSGPQRRLPPRQGHARPAAAGDRGLGGGRGEARRVFARYGYGEIRTPMLEQTELFVRAVGESTDIVGKEMYTFPDRKGRSLTLRPENTAAGGPRLRRARPAAPGRCRVKLFYIGPQFRYERPQKGRYRQFHQIGAELLGDARPARRRRAAADADRFLRELGLQPSSRCCSTPSATPSLARGLPRGAARLPASRTASALGRRQPPPAGHQPAAHPRHQGPGGARAAGRRAARSPTSSRRRARPLRAPCAPALDALRRAATGWRAGWCAASTTTPTRCSRSSSRDLGRAGRHRGRRPLRRAGRRPRRPARCRGSASPSARTG